MPSPSLSGASEATATLASNIETPVSFAKSLTTISSDTRFAIDVCMEFCVEVIICFAVNETGSRVVLETNALIVANVFEIAVNLEVDIAIAGVTSCTTFVNTVCIVALAVKSMLP